MSLRIDVDTSDVDRELRRLHDGFDLPDLLAMDRVLLRQYIATQLVVHVDTGSLRNSGTTVDGTLIGDEWRGEIRYGGASPGAVHDPVRYAIYEQARDGDHDFMTPLYDQPDQGYIDAIGDFFQGRHSL